MKPHKRKKTRAPGVTTEPAPLRVKFFSFKSNMLLDGRAINGALPSEHAVNDWLAKNPGIRIVEIRQSMCQMHNDNFATTLLTVWYEGGPSPEPPPAPVQVATPVVAQAAPVAVQPPAAPAEAPPAPAAEPPPAP
ncbi:MAG: hypothetical protein JNM56_31705 [Planctomycetia bacterium]|nr:hypothetical protein [Planctomycetia bacterium]